LFAATAEARTNTDVNDVHMSTLVSMGAVLG
jgi:hypothetical protein